MTTEDLEDAAFNELLRSVSRTPDVSALRRELGPGSELLGRFVMGRQLGEGGMGRVFAAFDRVRQTQVAIKMLGVLTPRSIVTIKREFRVAAELRHPNLVRLHELFNDGEDWFFAMDLLEGTTLRRLLATHKPAGSAVIEHVFSQLAAALIELHRSRTLHGDLKPSNFLIVGPSQRVVLLDFGVARPLGQARQDYAFAGTREYVAPEQSAGAHLTEAADWYSFGVVLFEALTGRLPVPGRLEQDLAGQPPQLAALCHQLLEPVPERRAGEAQVLLALGAPAQQAASVSRIGGAAPRLVGRAAELEQLMSAYAEAMAGRPQVVLVRGDSGIGKTALVEHFVRLVERKGAIVLGSRCREREATSYKAVDGLIDDLVEYLDRVAPEVAARLLPEGLDDLTRLFPTLRTAAAVVAHSRSLSVEGSDQSLIKQRAIRAFRDLLLSLTQRAPLVLWIDDLQWSDPHSAALLEPILTERSSAPLLLLGGSRPMGELRGPTFDVLYGQRAQALPEPQLVELPPLGSHDAESLARELLPKGADSDDLARDIAREAAGNPLFIAELVHQRDSLSMAVPLREPRSLNELVRGRVARLPEDARGVLEATALAGIPLPYTVARRSRGLTPNQAEEAIDLLRASHLVRTHSIGDERNIEMHHDRIREIVLQGLSREVRAEHHLRLARALAAERAVKPEILATHFFAGGQPLEAGRQWLKAADAAFEALAFAHAAELYERGMQLAGLDPDRLSAVRVQRAEALAYDGKGLAAADVYLAAAEGQLQDRAIELRRRAAEQLLLSGHLGRGLEVIGLVLDGLGMRRTRTGRRVLLSILLGRLRVRLRGLRFATRSAGEISQRELARVDASWSIACSLGVIDFMRGADFQNEHLLMALNAGEPRRLLRALTLEISYAATPARGSQQRTQVLLQMADQLAEVVDDKTAAGLVRVSRGVAAYLNGRLDEALVECQAGVDQLRRYVGTVWETVTAQRFIIASMFHLGRLRALASMVPPLLAETEAKGNLYASTFFKTTYSNVAWLVTDQVALARERLEAGRAEWTAPGVQLSHCWMLVGDANLALYTGERDRLWAMVERDWPHFVAAQFLRIAMLRVQLLHLRSVAALCEAGHQQRLGRASDARRLRHEARSTAARLAKQRISFARPLAQLTLAAADVAVGNLESGCQGLTSSIELFTKQGMRLYAAAARSRLGQLLGGYEGAALVQQGRGAFTAEGVVKVSSMLDLLAPGFPGQSPTLIGKKSAPALLTSG
jgi:eukaryotic-like serine/threonine-protein kinase